MPFHKRKKNGQKEEKVVEEDQVASLKEKGVKAFVAEEFEQALQFFTDAIEEDKKSGGVSEMTHILYSNRSAVYTKLKSFPKALDDANICVKVKDSWSKGYFRRGTALEQVYPTLGSLFTHSNVLSQPPYFDRVFITITAIIQRPFSIFKKHLFLLLYR